MEKLSILLIQQGDKWAAQCLQYNIAAQGNSIDAALSELQRSLVSEAAVCKVLGKNFDQDIPPAPPYFWRQFLC